MRKDCARGSPRPESSRPPKPGASPAFSSGKTEEKPMKQPHTEGAVKHTDDEQNTGNHPKPGAKQQGGPDRFGGTRAGEENVEPQKPDDAEDAKRRSGTSVEPPG